MKSILLPAVLVIGVILSGCSHPQRVEQTHETIIVQQPAGPQMPAQPTAPAEVDPETLAASMSRTLADLSQDVTNAADANTQSAALHRIWQYMRDNNLTYQLTATRQSSGQAVANPAGADFPIRAHMSIFKADRKLTEFDFNPIENQNLSFMTAGGTPSAR
jgi:hypothetical protein